MGSTKWPLDLPRRLPRRRLPARGRSRKPVERPAKTEAAGDVPAGAGADASAPARARSTAPRPRQRRPREDAAPAPQASGRQDRSDGVLTLARAFQLMSQALSEFRSAVGQEALRLRMVAMHGREDPLLDAARFPRLLRQANDAEVADVRKVGDDDYEISGAAEPARGFMQLPAPRGLRRLPRPPGIPVLKPQPARRIQLPPGAGTTGSASGSGSAAGLAARSGPEKSR